ncbi:MAG: hypothetical protein ACMG6E_03245 [Candidatus Roizmanbacteria bacterium]
MKIEYIITTVVGLFIFGYVLDLVSGPFFLPLTSPFTFLQAVHLTTYPFTAISIAAKTIAIFITCVLIIQKSSGQRYFLASTLFFISAALLELYAIQQIATQRLLISLQWTLAFSYSAIAILVPCLIYLLLGVFKTVHRNLTADTYDS